MPFVSLAIDHINPKVLVTGFGKTREDCIEHAERTESAYTRTFDLAGDNLGKQLYEWFVQSGITRDEAKGLVRSVGQALLDVMTPTKSGGTECHANH